jgi:hypothetical protein
MRKHVQLSLLVALAASVAWAGTARADDTLRCNSRLVSTGDGKDKVRALCGEPTHVSLVGVVRQGGYGPTIVLLQPGLGRPARRTGRTTSPTLLRKLRFIGDELGYPNDGLAIKVDYGPWVRLVVLSAADTMRCAQADQLGDTQEKVLQYCGEPAEQNAPDRAQAALRSRRQNIRSTARKKSTCGPTLRPTS